jgi:hypothetical protein
MKRNPYLLALILTPFLVADCKSYRSVKSISDKGTTVRIDEEWVLIRSVGTPGSSPKRIEGQRKESYRSALLRIEHKIKKMPVKQLIEKIAGATLEGAAGAADYSSTGIALSRDLTRGIVLNRRSIHEGTELVYTKPNTQRRLPEIDLDILRRGSIINKRYDINNNCEILYRIHVRDLIQLMDSYNRRLNTEYYDRIEENDFLAVSQNPLSTFSIDVDTASFSNIRRFLNEGRIPPKGAVRIEEMINYFSYEYPSPEGRHPFSVNAEIAICPWNVDHMLVLLALQGRRIEKKDTPPRNLVLLIDVSGSMNDENKLPLLKRSMRLLVRQLTEEDHLSIVVYAGAAGMVLPPTRGDEKSRILQDEDFNNDRKDAGELGAGHSVTVLYEVVPYGGDIKLSGVDPLRYQAERKKTEIAKGDEILFVKLRYKEPNGERSTIMTVPVADSPKEFNHSSDNLRFAASVAGFGMLLRDSRHKGSTTFASIQSMARSSVGKDGKGYRAEFLRMVRLAENLME